MHSLARVTRLHIRTFVVVVLPCPNPFLSRKKVPGTVELTKEVRLRVLVQMIGTVRATISDNYTAHPGKSLNVWIQTLRLLDVIRDVFGRGKRRNVSTDLHTKKSPTGQVLIDLLGNQYVSTTTICTMIKGYT